MPVRLGFVIADVHNLIRTRAKLQNVKRSKCGRAPVIFMSKYFPIVDRGERRFDVVTFGTNAVDHLITVPTYPAFDTKVELVESHTLPGGEAASTAVGLARLGLDVAYIGSFGDDAEGDIGMRSLIDDGVDVSQCRVISGARTQVGYIIIDQQTGERTVIWKRDSRLTLTPNDVSDVIPKNCRLLHVTPHDMDAATELARSARASGTTVSIDADRRSPGLETLLELVDVCILPDSLLSDLTGSTDTDIALHDIARRFGCSLVGVTLGINGSAILFDGEIIRTPAFEVPGGCVDTTGAGDAFRTGSIYGLLSNTTVEKAALYANATAALKCRMAGARAGLPDRQFLTMFCKKQ